MPEIPSQSDRTVHAEDEGIEVVRYDRAGKWFVESKRPSALLPARPVTLLRAAEVALRCNERGGTIHLRRPGGSRFDAKVRWLLDGRAELREQDRRAANL